MNHQVDDIASGEDSRDLEARSEVHLTFDDLREMKSLGEILSAAIQFETTARDFYQGKIEQVSKPLRELVVSLAEEEEEHRRMLAELASHPELIDVLRERVEVPPSDHKFSDYIQQPVLPDQPDDQTMLQYALSREQVAMEQYEALSLVTPKGSLHDLFTFLAREELSHKQELEKTYYEMVFK